jgi:hypothetical protein
MLKNTGVIFALSFLLFAACSSSSGGGGLPSGVGSGDGAKGTSDTANADAPAGDRDGAEADGAGSSTPSCTDNETRCGNGNSIEVCRDGGWVFIEVCNPPLACLSGMCQATGRCEAGKVLGCIDAHTIKRCTAEGRGVEPEPCPDDLYCLKGECGTQVCTPGAAQCGDANTIEYCKTDGSGWDMPQACGDGSICIAAKCVSGCEADYKFGSYVGCEYWTVDLDQYEDPFTNPEPIPHAIVIANPGMTTATLRFKDFNIIPVIVHDPTVPPGGVVAFEMPRLDLDGSGIFNRSIQVRSDRPVLAAQFNPLDYVAAASNDASLLLPRAVLGKEYYVFSWPSGVDMSGLGLPLPSFTPQNGYIAVLAVRPGITKVLIQLTAAVEATLDGPTNDVIIETPQYAKGQNAVFDLEQGQVVQLTALPMQGLTGSPNDLTGTHVIAERPVAVFGGHEEAVIDAPLQSSGSSGGIGNPSEEDGGCCAEHIEEQMLPVHALGSKVLCAVSPSRGSCRDRWRIIAIEPLELSSEPPQKTPDGKAVTALAMQKGEWIEIFSEDSFLLEGTGRIQVGQYLVSQGNCDRMIGDPALINGIPVEQWRDNYPVLTPDNYRENYLPVMKPLAQPVLLDGTQVPQTDFHNVGNTDYEIAHVEVQSGVHRVTAAVPFGLVSIGYDSAVSYGLPAGMDIKDLVNGALGTP